MFPVGQNWHRSSYEERRSFANVRSQTPSRRMNVLALSIAGPPQSVWLRLKQEYVPLILSTAFARVVLRQSGNLNAWRMGMQTNSKKAEQVGLPATSRLSQSYGKADFVDAFSVDLPVTACNDAESLARYIFAGQPKWIAMLLGVRDIAVWPFGLKRTIDLKVAKDDRLSIFRVFERHKDEIILGEDDTHLDFRVSVLVQPASEDRSQRLIITTLVFYNRLLGRAYLGLIAPFHRLVVRASLDRAQKLGWPGR
jgi:hypothetical protein